MKCEVRGRDTIAKGQGERVKGGWIVGEIGVNLDWAKEREQERNGGLLLVSYLI